MDETHVEGTLGIRSHRKTEIQGRLRTARQIIMNFFAAGEMLTLRIKGNELQQECPRTTTHEPANDFQTGSSLTSIANFKR